MIEALTNLPLLLIAFVLFILFASMDPLPGLLTNLFSAFS